jgi:hypothetical protein
MGASFGPGAFTGLLGAGVGAALAERVASKMAQASPDPLKRIDSM